MLVSIQSALSYIPGVTTIFVRGLSFFLTDTSGARHSNKMKTLLFNVYFHFIIKLKTPVTFSTVSQQ